MLHCDYIRTFCIYCHYHHHYNHHDHYHHRHRHRRLRHIAIIIIVIVSIFILIILIIHIIIITSSSNSSCSSRSSSSSNSSIIVVNIIIIIDIIIAIIIVSIHRSWKDRFITLIDIGLSCCRVQTMGQPSLKPASMDVIRVLFLPCQPSGGQWRHHQRTNGDWGDAIFGCGSREECSRGNSVAAILDE